MSPKLVTLVLFDVVLLLAFLGKKWQEPKWSRLRLLLPTPFWSAYRYHFNFADPADWPVLESLKPSDSKFIHDLGCVVILASVLTFAWRAYGPKQAFALLYIANAMLNAITSILNTDWLYNMVTRNRGSARISTQRDLKAQAEEMRSARLARQSSKGQNEEEECLSALRRHENWILNVSLLKKCGGERAANYLAAWLRRGPGGTLVAQTTSALDTFTFIKASQGPKERDDLCKFVREYDASHSRHHEGIVDMLRTRAEAHIAAGNLMREEMKEVDSYLRSSTRAYDTPNWGMFCALVVILLGATLLVARDAPAKRYFQFATSVFLLAPALGIMLRVIDAYKNWRKNRDLKKRHDSSDGTGQIWKCRKCGLENPPDWEECGCGYRRPRNKWTKDLKGAIRAL